VRELATIEELEDRIRKLEKRMSFQDEAIKRILDFVKRATDGQFERKSANGKEWKEGQERLKTESTERMNRIMKELGYKID
jgi:hypothetical protein